MIAEALNVSAILRNFSHQTFYTYWFFKRLLKRMCESTDVKRRELRMNATECVAESFVRPSGLQIEFRKCL